MSENVSHDQKMEEEEELEAMQIDKDNLKATEVDEEYLRKVSSDQQTRVATAISKSNFDDCLTDILLEEKSARKEDRMEDTVFVVLKTMEFCKEQSKWDVLIELLGGFSKRHGQFKQVTQIMVQTVMAWVNESPSDDIRNKLVDELLEVSEGKLYLELERARLTMFKCYSLENTGDMAGAAEVLKDFQVETYGAVEKREKTTYILEQMRIFLATSDPVYFTRAQIRSGHIGPKTLARFPDLALKYHQLEIEIFHKEEEYYKMSNALLHLRELADNTKEKDQAGSESVVACILAKYSKEQQQLLFKLTKDQKIGDISFCKKLLTAFSTHEIIRWPLDDGDLMEFLNDFRFTVDFGQSVSLIQQFRVRTIQHNIRVVEKYYTDIAMSRLAEFLGTDLEEMEKFVSDMVVSGEIHAKIDRLEQTIKFKRLLSPNEILNTWRNDIDVLVHKVENTCHQIQREQAIEAARAKAAKAAKRRKK